MRNNQSIRETRNPDMGESSARIAPGGPSQRRPISPAGGSSTSAPPATPSPPSRRLRRGIPPKLYRVGEVVDYSGVSRQTIHNYTLMGLIRESDWTRGGHRLYGEDVFGRLDTIADLRDRHKSLEFIRKFFVRRDTQKMDEEKS